MYIDPGSGAFIVQAVLGFLFAVIFYFKSYLLHPFLALFRKKTKNGGEAQDEPKD